MNEDTDDILQATRSGNARQGWAVFPFRSRPTIIVMLLRARDSVLAPLIVMAMLLAVDLFPLDEISKVLRWAAAPGQHPLPILGIALLAGGLSMWGTGAVLALLGPLYTLACGRKNLLVVTPKMVVLRMGRQRLSLPLSAIDGVVHRQSRRWSASGGFLIGLLGEGWLRESVVLIESGGRQHTLVDSRHFGTAGAIVSAVQAMRPVYARQQLILPQE